MKFDVFQNKIKNLLLAIFQDLRTQIKRSPKIFSGSPVCPVRPKWSTLHRRAPKIAQSVSRKCDRRSGKRSHDNVYDGREPFFPPARRINVRRFGRTLAYETEITTISKLCSGGRYRWIRFHDAAAKISVPKHSDRLC